MKRSLQLIIFLFSWISLKGQCDFNLSSNNVCGSENIHVEVINPDATYDYNFNFGDGSGKQDGIMLDHAYPGTSTVKTYTIKLYNGSTLCSEKTITVNPAPDADLTDIDTDEPFRNCSANQTQPQFTLDLSNSSGTISSNTSYTIDWGDGTPPFTATSWTTTSHTYTTLGQFTLKYTVTGTGFGACNTVTRTYTIFNGSNPDVGMISLGTTIGLCAPVSLGFQITGTQDNLSSTKYTVFIAGDKIYSYNHPPPNTFNYTFLETSCGNNVPGTPAYPNAFNVTIVAENVCSKKSAEIKPITIGTPPLPNFSVNPSILCTNEVITLKNTSLGSNYNSNGSCDLLMIANWRIEPDTGWTLVQGPLDSTQLIKVLFHNKGPYKVTLVVENNCGIDSITKTLIFETGPTAEADAVPDNLIGCAPLTVGFKNLSLGDNPSFRWTVTPSTQVSFVNGTTNQSSEPFIKFNKSGTYTVSLSANNPCGSSTWDTIIQVKGLPEIILATDTGKCDNLIYTPIVNYKDNLGTISDYVWSFPGGNPSSYSGPFPQNIVYNSGGIFSVQVDATNECGTISETQKIVILGSQNFNLGPDTTICKISDSIQLNTEQPGGIWSGNGITDSVQGIFNPQLTSGLGIQYPVTLTYTVDLDVCVATNQLTIQVVNQPNIDPGQTVSMCLEDPPLTLVGQSPSGGYWYGYGISDSTGIFDAVLTGETDTTIYYVYSNSFGCADTADRRAVVHPMPNFDLPPDLGMICIGSPLLFEILDTNLNQAVWDMGDGSVFGTKSLNYIYQDTGTFNITVFGQNAFGCADTAFSKVHIIGTPSFEFSLSRRTGCNGFNVDFNVEPKLSDVDYSWDFGNGIVDSTMNPPSIFFPPGSYFDTIYYIVLQVKTACGTASFRDSVIVKRTVIANFGVPNPFGCTPFTTNFFNTTIGSPTAVLWDFGNGQTSTDFNPPPITFTTGSKDTIYTVTLIVINECGKDTILKTIKVLPRDVMAGYSIDRDSGCIPLTVHFSNFSTPGAGIIWDFGDGNFSNLPDVYHTYYNEGNYIAALVAIGACSRDTITFNIHGLERPKLEIIAPLKGCSGSSIPISATVSNAINLEWDFGDGGIAFGSPTAHTYGFQGEYTITLIGTSPYGCLDTIDKKINITQTPVAEFNIINNPACAFEPLQIENLSSGADNFNWDFGDGTTSNNQVPIKSYSNPGFYDVQLIASKANFCFDTLVKINYQEILPRATADFTYVINSGLQNNGFVEFTNNSANASGYLWYFGDGQTSTEQHPEHTYATPGLYPVILYAINDFDCNDSIEKRILVDFTGQLFVPNALMPDLSGSEIAVFKPKGYGLKEYKVQVFSAYGDLIWESDKLENGSPVDSWDGTYKGKILPQDTYVWKIHAIFENGTSWEGMVNEKGKPSPVGVITLLR